MLSKYKRFLIPVAIIVFALLVFVILKATKPQQKQIDLQEKEWMVQVIEAKAEPLAPIQTLYGTVESNALVTVSSPLSGVVEKVLVKEGQAVKKGALLFALSAEDIEIPLAQAQANYDQAKAALTLQKLNNQANVKQLRHERSVLELKQVALSRTKQLMQKNLASQSTLDSAQENLVRQEYIVVGAELAVRQNSANLAQANAAYQKAQAELKQAQLNKVRGEFKAPYDARIAAVDVVAGTRVNAGSAALQFYALDSLELRAKLPVDKISALQEALALNQNLNAFHQGRSGDQPLKLLRLAGVAKTSGIDAFFELPAELSHKRPGELMEVRLMGLVQEGLIAVPYSAIYGNNRVYVVVDGRLQAKIVKLVGEVVKNNQLWALIEADFDSNTKISVTHLPNAVTGLKVLEVEM